MKTLSIISFYFLNLTLAQAGLEQNYQLIKGPTLCPIGNVALKSNPKEKERALSFGSSLSWTLSAEDKGVVKEVVEAGCTYTLTYEKAEKTFKATTIRSSCPKADENGVITESLELKNDQLTYQYDFLSQTKKTTKYDCTYNKRN